MSSLPSLLSKEGDTTRKSEPKRGEKEIGAADLTSILSCKGGKKKYGGEL